MKQFLLKFSAAFFLLLCCVTASAQDFEANGIYYNRLGGDSCEVTYNPNENYSGNVVIPSKVSDGGKTYTVTRIGNTAFSGCSELTGIEMPNTIKEIGLSAFWKCYGLKNVNIPSSVIRISSNAFRECTGLGSLMIPNSVTSIGNHAFQRCIRIDSLVISNSVTSIGNYAFSDCYSLRSVEIPNSVTSIGQYAFSNCSSLRSVKIPNSVTSIEYSAFYNCYGLTNATIGYSVKHINNMFNGCPSIAKLTVLSPEPPSASGSQLDDIDKYECTLYIPASIADKYRKAEGWKDFKNIVEIPDTTSIPLTLMQANDGKSYGTAYLPVSAKAENGENIMLYYASAPDNGNVQLHRIKDEWVPSHEGFVVIDESGAKRTMLKVKYSSTENTLTDNALSGCLNDSNVWTVVSRVYVLGLSNGVAGFYRPNNNIMKANRAYMLTDGQYRTLTFSFDNSVTGIEKIENTEKEEGNDNAPIYDLSGRRVYGNLPQGIYVKNGKKFIVK